MNLNALRYFYESAKYETLTEASQKLHISQPALTKHIKNLEREYHVQLIKKTGRNIELTDFGKDILKEAKPLFEQEKRIEALLENRMKLTELIIGTTQMNSHPIIQQLSSIKELVSNLKLITENTEKIFQLLTQEKIHFAILPEHKSFDQFEKEKLFSDKLIFVAHPDYCQSSLSQEDLNQYQFIKREEGSYLQQMLNEFRISKDLFTIEVTSHSDALLACEYQQGIYLCSNIRALELINQGKLKEVNIENFQNLERNIFLYFKQPLQTPDLNTLKKEIRNIF